MYESAFAVRLHKIQSLRYSRDLNFTYRVCTPHTDNLHQTETRCWSWLGDTWTFSRKKSWQSQPHPPIHGTR